LPQGLEGRSLCNAVAAARRVLQRTLLPTKRAELPTNGRSTA